MNPLNLSLGFFNRSLICSLGFFLIVLCNRPQSWLKNKTQTELKMTVGAGSWYMSCWLEIKKQDSALSTTFENCSFTSWLRRGKWCKGSKNCGCVIAVVKILKRETDWAKNKACLGDMFDKQCYCTYCTKALILYRKYSVKKTNSNDFEIALFINVVMLKENDQKTTSYVNHIDF